MNKKKGFAFGVAPAQTDPVFAGADAMLQPGGDGGVRLREMEDGGDVNAIEMREKRRLMRAERNRQKKAPAQGGRAEGDRRRSR